MVGEKYTYNNNNKNNKNEMRYTRCAQPYLFCIAMSAIFEWRKCLIYPTAEIFSIR